MLSPIRESLIFQSYGDHLELHSFPTPTLFRSAAAEAMRRILVERARHKASLKAGGDLCRQALDDIEPAVAEQDRKSTRLNSSHTVISYAVFCLKKKKIATTREM